MPSPSRRKLLYVFWTATAVFWIAIFVATHIPSQRIPDVDVSDKTAHFVAYFMLASLLYISTRLTNPARQWLGATVIAIAMVYGAIDELLQPLVGRHADFDDWLYDVAGATCAVFLLAVIRRLGCLRQAIASPESAPPSTPVPAPDADHSVT